MIVHQILQFLIDLKKHGHLTPFDDKFFNVLQCRFSQRNKDESISYSDTFFLLKCYTERWDQVFDTEDDYTINPIGVNAIWIEFSKQLALQIQRAFKIQINYLNVLIPVVTNTVDYNNLTLLSETNRLENLYLGDDNVTMYRKRGLCEHLKNTEKLSTCRDKHTRKLSPLSISELSRLQRCRQPDGAFSVDGENFFSFWDFLNKKLFTRLKIAGAVVPETLFALQDLIFNYHQLKRSGADYQLFKAKFMYFLSSLSNIGLDNINFFYGIRIKHAGSDYYLFELLIIIHQSQGFILDELLTTLDAWLIEDLKLHHREFENRVLCHTMMANDVVDLKDNKLYQCLSLILSLFTQQFTVIPLCGVSVKLWDKTRTVFADAEVIFSKLSPFLEQSSHDQLLKMYQQILDEDIMPKAQGVGLSSWMPRFTSTDCWYKHVQRGSLQELMVYVFEPEVIIHVLLQLNLRKSKVHEKLNTCLDELIHTYTQKHSLILKLLRVNMYSSDFMYSLDEEEHKRIITLFQKQDLAEARAHFLSNCNIHINNRLTQIFCDLKGNPNKGVSFFSKSDVPVFSVSIEGTGQVIKVIDAYKVQLPNYKLDSKIMDAMKELLMYLSRPILTVAEREAAAKSVNPLDYLNAPT